MENTAPSFARRWATALVSTMELATGPLELEALREWCGYWIGHAPHRNFWDVPRTADALLAVYERARRRIDIDRPSVDTEEGAEQRSDAARSFAEDYQ